MLGGAIAVRPVGWALMITFAILQIYNSLKSKKIMLSYNYIYIGVLIFILFFGGFTFTHFGRFEFTSTNGPVNLLIGANDNATGGFKSTVFEKGKIGYIKNSDTLTYIQKADYYSGDFARLVVQDF